MAKEKFGLFSFLKALTETKQDLTDHPLFEAKYNPFMITRWLSMNAECVECALYASKLRNVSKKQHYKFLLDILPHKKVYFSWKGGPKKTKDRELIMEYYDIGLEKALELEEILSKSQLKEIKIAFGGKKIVVN